MAIEFQRGDIIEVCGSQEGFIGSYFEATIISRIGAEEFIVEYRSLLNDDEMAPLREIVGAGEIRPRPPEEKVSEFAPREEVDAWDNEGWWRGRVVTRWLANKRYKVHFEESDEVKCYNVLDLRVHRDWVDGRWDCSGN